MFKNIIIAVLSCIFSLLLIYTMDKANLNTSDADNFLNTILNTLDDFGITFITYHHDQTLNITASIIIIVFAGYIIFQLLSPLFRKG